MDEIARLETELLDWCWDDYLSLGVIVRRLQDLYSEITNQEIREKTLQIVGRLLMQPDIRVGQFSKVGMHSDSRTKYRFDCWDMDVKDSLARINEEWNLLDGLPNVGEIAWLVTEEGCFLIS